MSNKLEDKLENVHNKTFSKDDVPSNRTKKLLLILAVSFLFVIVFSNMPNLGPNNVLGWIKYQLIGMDISEGYPKNIVGSCINDNNFKVVDKDVIALSDTSFEVLDSKGNEISGRQHNLSAPILKTGGNNSIIYSLGGTSFQIETKLDNIYKGAVKNNIISGAVAQNGSYALVTEKRGYLGELTVFSKKNEEKYKYSFSEYYINDVSISKNGRNIAVSGISSENGQLKSVIYVFKINSDRPILTLKYDNSMILELDVLSNGNVIAIGDTLTSVVNIRSKKRTNYCYRGKSLTSFDVDKRNGAVLSLASTRDSDDNNIVLVDSRGNADYSKETNLRIEALSYKNNTVAALCSGRVYLYNHSLHFKGDYGVGDDAKQVRLYTPRRAYILGVSEIRNIRLN